MARVLPARSALALAIALLAACGGGGGGSSAPPAASARCVGSAASFTFGDSNATAGKSAGAAVGGCTGALSEIAWTQTGGPQAVPLLSAQTPAIGFDAPAAGSYAFSVSYRVGGAPRSDVVTVAVGPAVAAASTVSARVDQAVRKGGNVSLRAWDSLAAGDSMQSIDWAQIEGPAVTLDTSDPRRAIFRAPDVSTDTLLRFRVTLRTNGGSTDSDEVAVLVENAAQAPADNNGPFVWSGDHVSRVHAYKRSGPFAGVLVRCVYDAGQQWTGSGKNLCPLSTLPFLHQTTGGLVPTTAQIMDRVVVSHDWMGEVFEQFLDSGGASADLKRLFNGVTAIVIGAHVRPSFYYALTGAIYLDADNVWLTATQRDVIDEAPDFRSDFDRDLQYTGLWRYVDESNAGIFLPFPADSRLSRDIGYLRNELTWLLYHELAHASDFMPPARRSALNSSISAWDNIAPLFSSAQLPSDALAANLPLQSAEMRALAQVQFVIGPQPAGAVVNGIPYSTLTSYSPATAAGFFAADRASDEYNYTTTREDIAMLFEEFMQQRNHRLRRDAGFTDKAEAGSTGSTLIVRWGQRGRIGEASVRPRIQQVLQALAPWVDAAGTVSALPAPLPMRNGESWTANLCLPTPCAAPVAIQRAPFASDAERRLLARAMRQPLLARGAGGHWTPNERILRRLRNGQ